MTQRRITASAIAERKARGEKVVCLSCYDYPTARIVDEAGGDLILVGDSLGNVVLGYDTTLPVTMEEVLHHAKAVVRGSKRAHICFDMPFLSFQISPQDALANAGRAVKEAGIQSVKIEGGRAQTRAISCIIEAGIPVLGHLGYLPQSAHVLGRKRLADTQATREALLTDARALEEAGCFAIVLETVPTGLAHEITQAISIPTIGIGSGPLCDGQILVLHDMLGLGEGKTLKHVKRYAELDEIIANAVKQYTQEVKSGAFPGEDHSF